jgi:uncharacterized protein GlcG (DUF336 family)
MNEVMLLAKRLLLHYREEEFPMLNSLRYYLSGLAFGLLVTVSPSVTTAAQTVLSERQISLALAGEAAEAAVMQCRINGFRVTATVVDRSGLIKAVMRDDGTGPHTLDASLRKAFTSASFRISSAEFANRVATNPAAANLKDIKGVIALGGGLPIRSGDEVIGAIGVGGAPGGDRDEACAQAGINKIAGRL